MSSIFEMAGDSVVSLSGIFIGVFGVLLAFIFYFKSKKYKILKYSIYDKTIIHNLNSRLEGLAVTVTYNGVTQEQVGVSTVTIWNGGTETISSGDIPESRPLSIVVPNTVKILDISIIDSTDSSLGFSLDKIQINQNSGTQIVKVDFDYIDQNDGTIVQIVHDNGKGVNDIEVDCKIKGGLPTRKLGTFYAGMPDMPRFIPKRLSKLIRLIFFIIAAIICSVLIVKNFISETPLISKDITLMLVGAFVILVVLLFAWVDLRSLTTERMPTQLDKVLHDLFRRNL